MVSTVSVTFVCGNSSRDIAGLETDKKTNSALWSYWPFFESC